ncbi:MAG TPA: hypothetical protein VFK13_03925 [Gemmatimonadaceae bacterium]|nr:hypothetical protein [Gemmatimonadaceae bacterium]
MRANGGNARRGGFALLAVLWVIAVMAILGATLAAVGRTSVQGARNRIAIRRARWKAEGCGEELLAQIGGDLQRASQMGGDATSRSWNGVADRLATQRETIPRDDIVCTARATAAGATLDVNNADGDLLQHVLAHLGYAHSDSLTDVLLDWRDADDDPRERGAEREWYAAHGRSPPRNGPIADVRELSDIRGFDRLDAVTLIPLDSVLGVEPGRIALNQAPPLLLSALPGFTAEAVQRVMVHRARGEPVTDVVTLAGELSPEARAPLQAALGDLSRLTTTEPDAWILTIRARAGTPAVTVVVELRIARAGTRPAVVRRRNWLE